MSELWVTAVASAGLLLAAVAAVVLAQAGSAGLVARFELVRLARGGRQPLLRGLVALGSLGGLMLAYLRASDAPTWGTLLGRVDLPRDRLAGVGETVLLSFLAVQLLAIYLAGPVVAAGGVAREKERKTLDDLLGTGLSAWDIVAGKFLAAWLSVLGVAAAGAPALTAASLLGGVDPETLFGGAVVIAYGSAGLCAAATRAAARRGGLREALAPLYGALAGLALAGLACGVVPGAALASPASALVWLAASRGLVGAPWVALSVGLFAAAYASYSIWALKSAARWLACEPPPPPPVVPERRAFPGAVPVYGVEAREPRALAATSAVPEEGAFAWKESRGAAGGARPVLLALVSAGLAVGAVFLSTVAADWRQRDWAGDGFNPAARLGLVLLAVVAPLAAGVRAAGAVARERERGTLDGLLATPAERRELLGAKFAGAARGAATIAAAVALLLALSAAAGGVYPVGALAGFAAGAGTAAAAAAAGLYFSAGARTSLRAALAVAGGVFALWVSPLALSPLAPPGETRAFVTALSPPVGAFRAGGPWRYYRAPAEPELDAMAIAACAATGAAGGAAAVVFWLAARRRFERLGR